MMTWIDNVKCNRSQRVFFFDDNPETNLKPLMLSHFDFLCAWWSAIVSFRVDCSLCASACATCRPSRQDPWPSFHLAPMRQPQPQCRGPAREPQTQLQSPAPEPEPQSQPKSQSHGPGFNPRALEPQSSSPRTPNPSPSPRGPAQT